jgi:hypothetical protein
MVARLIEGAGLIFLVARGHWKKTKIHAHQDERIIICQRAPPRDTTRSLTAAWHHAQPHRRAPARPASTDRWQTATEPSWQGGEELQEAVRSAPAKAITEQT